MDGTTWGYIISAIVTGIFGLLITWQNWRLSKKVRTNHGKTIGQHVELASAQAEAAKAGVDLVALQLDTYKRQQAAEALEQQRTIESYVAADALAHAQLRELIVSSAAITQANTRTAAAEIQASQTKR